MVKESTAPNSPHPASRRSLYKCSLCVKGIESTRNSEGAQVKEAQGPTSGYQGMRVHQGTRKDAKCT